MKLVSIVNSKTGQSYGAKFADDIEMQSWIDEQVSLESWGRGERILNEKQAIKAGLDIKDAVEIIVRQEEKDDGLPEEVPVEEAPIEVKKIILVDVNYYRFAPEYVITITDISLDVAAEEKIQEDKLSVKARLKELLVELDGSKVTNELVAKSLKQVIVILLDEAPAPDLTVKAVEP